MIKVLLEEGKEPILLESCDSPNDKTFRNLVEIIADTVDLTKYANKQAC